MMFAQNPSTQEPSSALGSTSSEAQNILDLSSENSQNSKESPESALSNGRGLSPEEVQFASQLSSQNKKVFSGFSSKQRQLAMQIASKLQDTKNPITPDMAVESVQKYSDQSAESGSSNTSDSNSDLEASH